MIVVVFCTFHLVNCKLILVMDIVLGGDDSSSSKLSEAQTSTVASLVVADEISNESAKLSLSGPPDSESVPVEETPKSTFFINIFYHWNNNSFVALG